MPKRLSEELRDGGVREGLRESSSLGDIEASICARVAAVSAAAGCELLKSNQTLAAASSASTCSKQSCSIERVLTKRAPPDVSAQTVAKTNCAPAIPPELRTTTQPSGNTYTRGCVCTCGTSSVLWFCDWCSCRTYGHPRACHNHLLEQPSSSTIGTVRI